MISGAEEMIDGSDLVSARRRASCSWSARVVVCSVGGQAVDMPARAAGRPLAWARCPSPSTTQINGWLVIRAAIVKDRTEAVDVDRLVDAVLAASRERTAKAA